jgi:hypothetical protein
VAVEALQPGDVMVTMLGSGPAAVRWIGHRKVNCCAHPVPEDVWPVRITVDAFAPGMPARDLYLSPDHAVYAGGGLIPARYLVNGASITQVAVDSVIYFHVELEPRQEGESGHDVLLAEGLPAESYLDTGNRGSFANGGGAMMLHPDFALRVWDTQSCAKLMVEGEAVRAVQVFLLTRAAELGHARTDDPGIVVEAGGRTIHPEQAGEWLRFTLPAGVRRAGLRSRVMVPAHFYPGNSDHRRLGVALAALRLDGVAAGPQVGEGWHAPEEGWQWTDGAAMLDCAGALVLELKLVRLGEYWMEQHPQASHAAA